jgi:hypothetical protein
MPVAREYARISIDNISRREVVVDSWFKVALPGNCHANRPRPPSFRKGGFTTVIGNCATSVLAPVRPEFWRSSTSTEVSR